MTDRNFNKLAECKVFNDNKNAYQEKIENYPALERGLENGWSKCIEAFISEKPDLECMHLNIYSGFSEKLQNRFSLTRDEALELEKNLENFALSYLSFYKFKNLRPMIKQLHSECSEINKYLDPLVDQLEEHSDSYREVLNVLSYEGLNADEYIDAFNLLVKARNKLKSLPDSIAQSPLAIGSDFKKAARSTNWALFIWVEILYAYWVNVLCRTISNSNDGINGRKPLLEFLLFCIEPLHESVEYDTLDNMLRKVQRETQKRGGLSDSDFRVGTSSPLGVV